MTSAAPFHSTRWTLVRRAQGRGEEARTALSELCAIYYEPVFHFVSRWCGDADEARDLAHGFFEGLLGQENRLDTADPAKGRFRSYLLVSVKHFLLHHRDRQSAGRRGGDLERVSLETAGEVSQDWDFEFDQVWVLALIGGALAGLQAEMETAGKGTQFSVLRPWLDGGGAGDVVAAGVELGLSATALKVAIHRLRHRFRQRVREAVAATVEDPAEVPQEFRHLVDVWVRYGSGAGHSTLP